MTRRVDIFDPAVVTIAQIVAGTTNNIIPETAFLYGTIRAVSEGTRELAKRLPRESPRAWPPPTARRRRLRSNRATR